MMETILSNTPADAGKKAKFQFTGKSKFQVSRHSYFQKQIYVYKKNKVRNYLENKILLMFWETYHIDA